MSLPHESSFYTPQKIRNAIDWLQFKKAQDHHGFAGEHFIYAHDILLFLLAYVFDRAMCEGFPSSWIKDSMYQYSRADIP